MSSLLQICQYIDSTPSSTAFRESLYVFPIVEGTHVIALAISVGLIMWFDLRLVGLILTRQPVSAVFNPIRPIMLAGFGIMFATGAMLFWGLALRCYGSPFFWAKMIMLVLAGLNIGIYHLTIDRRRNEWDDQPIPPTRARLAGLFSIILWVSIITVGRMMAYFL